MKKKNIRIISVIAGVAVLLMVMLLVNIFKTEDEAEVPPVQVVYIEPIPVETNVVFLSTHAEEAKEMQDLTYLAKCVEAEAGNQSLLGKRLVVDVILNRVNDNRFPDTIIEVINQEGQFAVVGNGSLDKAEPSEETYQAIEMEMEAITDSDIIYFTSTKYIGTPCYKLDAHYFGK